MFNSSFQEASSNSATFPEDTTESFDLLLEWIYHNSVRPLKASKTTEIKCEYSLNCYAFYNLARKLCLPHLQDHIIDVKR
jgi:hypothetical protein